MLTLLSESLNGQRPICSFCKNPAPTHKVTLKSGFCYLCVAYIKCKHAMYKHPSSLNGKSPSESRGTSVPRTSIHVVKLFLPYGSCLCLSSPSPYPSRLGCACILQTLPTQAPCHVGPAVVLGHHHIFPATF